MKWINIEDSKPVFYTDVLICTKFGDVMPAYLYEIYGKEIGFKQDARDKYLINDVTHWMPLPLPPTSFLYEK